MSEPTPTYTIPDDYVILMSPEQAARFERRIINMLHVLWEVQGKRRKIVTIK